MASNWYIPIWKESRSTECREGKLGAHEERSRIPGSRVPGFQDSSNVACQIPDPTISSSPMMRPRAPMYDVGTMQRNGEQHRLRPGPRKEENGAGRRQGHGGRKWPKPAMVPGEAAARRHHVVYLVISRRGKPKSASGCQSVKVRL